MFTISCDIYLGIPLIGSSLARSETPNRGFSSKLPPPNPILNT